MAGGHTASHIAALAFHLPPGSCLKAAIDPDAGWTRSEILLAAVFNDFNAMLWGMGDPKSRGPEPHLVGPSWMAKGRQRTHTLAARAMPIDELMEILTRPRG